jgi:hypothetical protein
MPKAKTTTKKKTIDASGSGYRLSGFLIIVIFASLGLVWLWLQLPKKSDAPRPSAPVVNAPVEPTNPQKAACEAARGKWVDCGNPCHGKPGEVCTAVCEPQCLCGGIAGWGCPKDLVCSDYEPSATTPDALGVCRTQVSKPESTPEPEPTTPVRERPVGMLCDDRNFICVDESVSGSLLTNPFIIEGSGMAFENTINWKLLDANNDRIAEGFVTASAADVGQAGDFQIRDFLRYAPKSSNATLQVFEYSAKDGSPIHIVSMPVRLPTTTMKTKFFMPSGSTTDCSEVDPVELDVVRSSLPVETALRTLLGVGPTMSSKRTAIPIDTKLVSLKVSNGTATVVLSPELGNYGGGSCNVGAIRSQIEATLKQFSSVRNVVIIQQGKTAEETLQP